MSEPFVTVVLPCRNERAYIARCLDSVLANEYPRERLEVLVVDGMSDDGTREIVRSYVARAPHLAMLDNAARLTPAALNLGIQRARGDIIIRMDAHGEYPRDYIGSLVAWLDRSGADAVGGVLITRPANDSAKSRAIAVALSHPFGVGNARFRTGIAEPRLVDTVASGCYRRDVFTRIGLFDDDLARNQDDELNHRLLRRGGKILLVPNVTSVYFARDAIWKVARMYYQYGYFKPLVARKIGGVLTVRQLVPSLFVVALLGALVATLALPRGWLGLPLIAGSYLVADLACSLNAARRVGVGAAAWLLVVFPVLHLSYGIGFLRGALEFLLLRRPRPANLAAVPLSR